MFRRRDRSREQRISAVSGCDSCQLAVCPAGSRAAVVSVGCPVQDAHRLRTLGLFEGAHVDVVDTRSGILLNVRGSRLALGLGIAAAITVRLLPA